MSSCSRTSLAGTLLLFNVANYLRHFFKNRLAAMTLNFILLCYQFCINNLPKKFGQLALRLLTSNKSEKLSTQPGYFPLIAHRCFNFIRKKNSLLNVEMTFSKLFYFYLQIKVQFTK
ncbi:hypothetical protein AYR54_01940 [Loigolactobacillus backii]|nr:hypothetical protein AYR52_01950 [Loigolactobacillus backii]ANK64124.1 hypothetical protein AYR54_01940 [Loigolactobacillus backii]ANK67482.1 hypothetical protein AYR55_07100 [Loigolactobacillus backii]OLF69633.1 hypothetical protein ACX53_06920 [Loigolactobacillus backii]PIO88205.1 hypothetical protein B8A32_03820 [Loigolactobacillus backii]